jgi:hypothetical protein
MVSKAFRANLRKAYGPPPKRRFGQFFVYFAIVSLTYWFGFLWGRHTAPNDCPEPEPCPEPVSDTPGELALLGQLKECRIQGVECETELVASTKDRLHWAKMVAGCCMVDEIDPEPCSGGALCPYDKRKKVTP